MKKQRHRHRKKMLSLARQWEESGQTQKTFCSQRGLPVSTLGYWLGQLRRQEASPSGFVPLTVSTSQEATLEIHYPNGIFVKAPAGIDAGLLRTLLTPA